MVNRGGMLEDADVSEPGKYERRDEHPSGPSSAAFLLHRAVIAPEAHPGSSHVYTYTHAHTLIFQEK